MTPDAATLRPAPGLLHALGGVWRLTYPGFFARRRLLLLAGLSVLLYFMTAENVRHDEPVYFHRWVVEFHLAFLLPAVAFLAAAGAMRDDMLPVSVDYLLTRPVRRSVYVVCRYLAHMACLQLSCLVPLAAACAAGAAAGLSGLEMLLPRVLLAQFIIVAGFTALGFLVGSLTSRYLVVGVLYGLIVEVGVGHIPTQVGKLSMTHHILAMFAPVVPGLDGVQQSESALAATLALGLFTALFVAGSAAVMTYREFTGAAAAEK